MRWPTSPSIGNGTERTYMKRFGSSLLLMGLATSVLFLGTGYGALTEVPVVLLTAEEGALANPPASLIDAGSSLDTGPSIEVVKPEQNVDLRSPVSIIVRFVPNGKEVDLSLLKVEVLKLFAIDITDRVLPYTTRKGIQADNAILPAGEHKLRVTIGDVEGGVSRKVFLVKIL